jgi:hypothetical protein
MRHFLIGGVIALATCGCSKTGKKSDNNQLPAHITGTVKSLDISYIDMEPAIPNGIFQINGSDGKVYHFKFAKVADMYLIGENCTMSLDTTMVLDQDVPFADTTVQLLFKRSYLPNSITIRFYDTADLGDTHGVKDMTATFTTDTEIWADFLNYDNRPAYTKDRTKAINKINAIVHAIKDASSNPGNQPARIICQAYTY